MTDIARSRAGGKARWLALFMALRPAQWSKSFLLLGPALFAHTAPNGEMAASLILGMVLMSLTASAGYLINDLADREADRAHPLKRQRPIASGLIGMGLAMGMAAALALVATGLAVVFLGYWVALLLAGYLLASVTYTALLKTLPVVDVVVLALLYMWRLVIGGAIAGIFLSEWLLGFGFCLFVALALTKRLDELSTSTGDAAQGRRFYVRKHRNGLLALCIIFAVAAMATLVGYVGFSSAAVENYRNHGWLGLAAVLLGLWLAHIVVSAARGRLDGDPVLFSLSDPLSLLLAAATGLSLVAAV